MTGPCGIGREIPLFPCNRALLIDYGGGFFPGALDWMKLKLIFIVKLSGIR